MGKHFALSLKLPKYKMERQIKNGISTIENRIWGISVLTAAGLLLLFYMIQVNSFSTKGYEIKNLQTKVESLRNDQRALEVQSAELQSLQRIQSSSAVLNMVSVSTISYVQTKSLSAR
ncbi:MAG: hypothetical protein NVSMB66_1200 [Candidatus Doudnabacteria bacterium]